MLCHICHTARTKDVSEPLVAGASTLPSYIGWTRFLSWLMYSNEAMSIIQWEGITNIKVGTSLHEGTGGQGVLNVVLTATFPRKNLSSRRNRWSRSIGCSSDHHTSKKVLNAASPRKNLSSRRNRWPCNIGRCSHHRAAKEYPLRFPKYKGDVNKSI
uniref:Uncharacterized protein n=1 Tax=Timema douglasi TaxID=61478 RepID=A0A7R8ZA50_TIMDO|nr:unnamed protein product [Timema douglasi]